MVKKLKDANAPKRPQSAYFLWLNANRDRIVKKCGTKDVSTVGKAAGAEWGGLSDKDKKPYDKKAAAAKAKYATAIEKYRKSANFTKFQEEKKAFDKKQKIKNVQEPEGKPKRPASGYMRWMAAERPKLVKAGFSGVADIGKEAGKRWKGMGDKQKAKWNNKATKDMAAWKEEMVEWKESDEYKEYLEEKAAVQQKFKDEERREKKRLRKEQGGGAKKKAKTSAKK